MCDTAMETDNIAETRKQKVFSDSSIQTDQTKTADFSCHPNEVIQLPQKKDIQISEKDKDDSSMLENSFNTMDASKSADKFNIQGSKSELDDDTDLAEAWIPDIEKYISKFKLEKKASTFFHLHNKEKVSSSGEQSPHTSQYRQLPDKNVEEESKEAPADLVVQLSKMFESYKQVCKERDYWKRMLKPYVNNLGLNDKNTPKFTSQSNLQAKAGELTPLSP